MIHPQMMTNTIGVRFVDWKDTWAATFDFLMSAINHSCMPNAFASIEGGKLIVRSLGPIRAEEEITISYAEQIVDVFHRRQWLKRLYFFDCNCKFIHLLTAIGLYIHFLYDIHEIPC